MDAPLSVHTKEEQRSVIRFLWSEGVSGATIHQTFGKTQEQCIATMECLRMGPKTTHRGA